LPVPDNEATVRQLLAMRSGIREFVGGPQTVAAEQQPDRHWTPDEALEDVPDQTDEAGALFEYSNSNYLLLGQLIEKVTNGSYSAALHRDLLTGAGVAEIAVQDEERPQAPLARAPADIAGDEPYLPSRSLASLAWAAGGISGRAESVARWGYLLYGGHVLDPELVATMLPREDGSGYGYGTEKLGSVIPGIEYVGHRGDFGPYRTALAVTRDRPLSIAVLLTRRNETADPMNVVEALTEILVR
jgi:CubicO group peptidase (beta-lactamase class C family)